MSTFRIGDRVVVTYPLHPLINKLGTIIKVYPDAVGIAFDENVQGHSCSGLGPMGHCWIFNKNKVQIYQTLSKEEHVLNKCKYLWNKSKYVETFKKAY